MGGLWEAGVKSLKIHLKKMIPNLKFTFEELSTILTRIESCLNSRPLSPASDDPNDLNPLTPGHFLIGSTLLTPAEPDISSENLSFINRWKRLKVIYHSFCQRWKSEYLLELQRRYKWKIQRNNVKINDPNEWQMGRIIKIYLGPDQKCVSKQKIESSPDQIQKLWFCLQISIPLNHLHTLILFSFYTYRYGIPTIKTRTLAIFLRNLPQGSSYPYLQKVFKL